MADSENPTNGDPTPETPPAASVPGQQQHGQQQHSQQQQQSVRLDDSHAQAFYSNFCRVSSTPEEMILDLGLNPQPFGTGEVVVPVNQRIILNHFTAKRLLGALQMAVQRHEQAFGPIEIDVRKRVRNPQQH